MSRPIAITAAGVLTPLGADGALWARYRERTRGPAPVPVSAFPELPLGHLPETVRARALRAERVTALALAAAGAALAAGGLDTAGARRDRTGVVLGTGFGCFLTNAAFQDRLGAGGPGAASPRLFAATVSNAAAGELAIAYRLGGPGITLSAGAASGLVALGHAADALRSGRADALLAGGVDALGPPLGAWLAGGGLAPGRPVVEAAAMLVLEDAEGPRVRGAGILATLLGHASGFEPHPGAPGGGAGLAATIAAALAAAGAPAAQVDLVVLAAPPPLAGLEARALAGALGGATHPRWIAPKDVLGETVGAAGPLGLLAALGEAAPGGLVLVLDVCASGHVAALVARAGARRP